MSLGGAPIMAIDRVGGTGGMCESSFEVLRVHRV